MSEAIDFNKYQGGYEQSESSGNYELPELGEHDAQIVRVQMREFNRKDGDELGIAWKFHVPATGYRFEQVTWMNKRVGWITANWLRVMGVTTKALDEIDAALPGLVGAMVRVSVEERNGYRNLHFIKRLLDAPAPVPVAAAAVADDEIPF